MSEHRAQYPVRTQCRLLGVSASGFYAWQSRPPSARRLRDEAHRERISEIHAESRETYGSPRIHAELAEEGIQTSRKRVQRLMRELGLEGASRRRTLAHDNIIS